MPIEARPGQARPFGLPNFQQFGERSTPGTPGYRSGERRGSIQQGGAVMPPLARNLIGLLEQERQRVLSRSEYSQFSPQWWMFNKILEVGNDYSPHWRRRVLSGELEKEGIDVGNINVRPELSDQELDQRQRFFTDIQTAYGIAAYPQFTPKQKNRFREELREEIRDFNIGNVTLTEQQRVVLQHIAAATNTPIDPHQETYHYYTVLQQPDITKAEMRADPRYSAW